MFDIRYVDIHLNATFSVSLLLQDKNGVLQIADDVSNLMFCFFIVLALGSMYHKTYIMPKEINNYLFPPIMNALLMLF